MSEVTNTVDSGGPSGGARGSALKPRQYQCSKCGKIISFDRRGKARGWCASCEVASWSPEKRNALNRVIGAAIRGEHDKLPDLTNEAMKHCALNK